MLSQPQGVFSHMTDFNEAGAVALGQYLQSRHYRFTTVTPATHASYLTRHRTGHSLRDIFGWNLPFKPEVLREDELQIFGDSGVIAEVKAGATDSHCLCSKVRYSTAGPLLLMHSGYPTREVDSVFFGPDTYRFLSFLNRYTGPMQACRRILDVGTGSGAAALMLAQQFSEATVTASDINTRALTFAGINAQLASLENVELVYSNLYSALDGNFDLIVANPPYLLDAEERSYRHGGGAFGEGLAYSIVEGALSRLAPGGTLLLYTGVAMVCGRDPFYEKVIDLLAGHGYQWRYEEIDPDVFGEELMETHYHQIERIAAVGLVVKRRGGL